jgi:FkbH-like protein
LWHAVQQHCSARVVQHNFVTSANVPLGHLACRVAGSRYMMTQQLNVRLGVEAGRDVSIVDCERLAAWIGKKEWFDSRYWHLAKHAVALKAVPLLARHTASVMAASLGLARKCLVLDLDNTLWGGVIGEDGLAGIRLGNGPEGEAFVTFQEFLLRLKEKGVILAVCSKNDEEDARLPFEQHPDMRLGLDDISLFVANWQSKAENLLEIAKTLNIGVDSLVFVDDNPLERAEVRELAPEVEVIPLPPDPALYVETLAQYPGFETACLTEDDRRRTEQYVAKARGADLKRSVESLDEFHRSLQMQATVGHFDDIHLPRIAQLIGKTNQFNLTTRRYSLSQLKQMMDDPAYVHLYLRLRDRFTDHGLVSVAIAIISESVLEIDTLLMSCRVMGRTVEATMLHELCRVAFDRGCTHIRGVYRPTAKNTPVKDLFSTYGFEHAGAEEGGVAWVYDLMNCPPIENEFIETTFVGEPRHEPAPAT